MKRILVPLLTLFLLCLCSGVVLAAQDENPLTGSDEWKLIHKSNVSSQFETMLQQSLQEQYAKNTKFDEKKAKPGQKFKMNKQIKEQYKSRQHHKAPFSDTGKHWAQPSIDDMVAAGILSGYPDGTFKPDQPITEAEIITLLMRIVEDDSIVDEDEDDADDDDLSGIPEWARHSAEKAHGKGIINLNRFHSQQQATRVQAVVWIAKALDLEPVDTSDTPFKDGIYISSEDLGYILAALDAGIISGMPDGNFNPNSCITRAQIASIIERILSQSDDDEPDEDAVVLRISLPDEVTLEQGDSKQLTATVYYSDGTRNHDVEWDSDDTDLVTVSSSGVIKAADDETGTVIITAAAADDDDITATCEVTVVKSDEEEVTLTSTGSTGGHDGKVYEEFVLKVDGEEISLSEDEVESITLRRDGGTPSVLVPDSDTTLWFNVQKPSGEYTLEVEDNDGNVYTATFDWTEPEEVDAVLTGEEGEHNGNTYVEYELEDLDLSEFDCMYQIKPDDSVAELNANSDSTLWFKVSNQQEGTHIFLVKIDGEWYQATVEYED